MLTALRPIPRERSSQPPARTPAATAAVVLDAFTKTWRHRWGPAVRAAFADALRSMVVDEGFDWVSNQQADMPSGPGAWRLLLPGRRQRAASDLKVQSMSEEDMQQWYCG